MRRSILAAALLALPLFAHAGLRVFACEPEWGALARELLAADAEVYVATTAQQDPHYIQARPSLLAKMRRADLMVCNGAELEIGWLPVLLQRAGNPAVQPGQPGHFLAADQVTLLDIPEQVDRSGGDMHASGNPHLLLDPGRILDVAKALAERLQQVDAAQADLYQQRFADFEQRWKTAMAQWQQRARALQGLPVVVEHSEWRYLREWTGIRVVAKLEAKPGIPPSSRHLAQVLAVVEQQKPAAVLTAPGRSAKGPNWLHKRAGLPVVELPYTVGGSERASDLFGLFEDTLARLEQLRS